MKALWWMFAAVAALGGFSQTHSAKKKGAAASDKQQLIGAWRLAWMEEPGTDGKLHRITDRTGALLYTSDGHMSVQVMYPKSESNLSNEYVRNGYEASFGSYDVNEAAHTLTHHIEGANVPTLIGKFLPRAYKFSEGRLTIRSTRADEHWSVTWERNPRSPQRER